MDSHITEVFPALWKSIAAFTIWDTAAPLAAPIRSARRSRHLRRYRRTHCVVSARTPQPPPRGTRRIGVPNPERRRCTSVLRQRSRRPWRLCSEAEGVRSTYSRESRECLATTLPHRCFLLSVSGRARCESWSPQALTRSSAGPRNRCMRSLSRTQTRLEFQELSRRPAYRRHLGRNLDDARAFRAGCSGVRGLRIRDVGGLRVEFNGLHQGGGVSAGTAETSRAKSWAWRSISASAPKAATCSLCTCASMARAGLRKSVIASTTTTGHFSALTYYRTISGALTRRS